jgi:heat shock protein HtpX
MALGTVGLATWQWNNNLKSLLLVGALPLMLLGLLWAIIYSFMVASVGWHGLVPPSLAAMVGVELEAAQLPQQVALLALVNYWHWVLGVAAAWTLLGYVFQDWFIRQATGARSVTRAEQPVLYNLLENLCISRGLRVPRLHIVNEAGLNAFASGTNEATYAITVTNGLLVALTEDELEAVLAHELTHIINRDVRLMMVVIIFAGMISFLAHMMWRNITYVNYSVSYRRDESRRNGSVNMLMLVAWVFLLIGTGLALLLRLALSRRREFLADAGAVDLTHKPEAMIAALKKISGHANVPAISSEIRQLFIENPPSSASLFGLFATHPPIEQRIAVLEKLSGITPTLRGTSRIPVS